MADNKNTADVSGEKGSIEDRSELDQLVNIITEKVFQPLTAIWDGKFLKDAMTMAATQVQENKSLLDLSELPSTGVLNPVTASSALLIHFSEEFPQTSVGQDPVTASSASLIDFSEFELPPSSVDKVAAETSPNIMISGPNLNSLENKVKLANLIRMAVKDMNEKKGSTYNNVLRYIQGKLTAKYSPSLNTIQLICLSCLPSRVLINKGKRFLNGIGPTSKASFFDDMRAVTLTEAATSSKKIKRSRSPRKETMSTETRSRSPMNKYSNDEQVQAEEIRKEFARYGTINNVHINSTSCNKHIFGCAVIEFAARQEAEEAVRKSNKGKMMGARIDVKMLPGFYEPAEGKVNCPREVHITPLVTKCTSADRASSGSLLSEDFENESSDSEDDSLSDEESEEDADRNEDDDDDDD